MLSVIGTVIFSVGLLWLLGYVKHHFFGYTTPDGVKHSDFGAFLLATLFVYPVLVFTFANQKDTWKQLLMMIVGTGMMVLLGK